MRKPAPDHEIEIIDIGDVEVTVVLDAGPRILGYADRGGPQLFAALPGEFIDEPGGFEFIGGHRLWRAPEIPAVTHQSDNDPVVVDRLDDGVRLTGAPDADHITRTITLRQLGAMTVVDHTLLNRGAVPVRCAAWAITQLAPGGTAVLPQSLTPADAAGMLPNRAVVFWPYTDPSAPEIEFRSSELRIHASETAEKSKIGQANRRGWTAYAQGNQLFVKWSPLHQDSRDYADLGASVECYRDQRFLELESLGPLADLEPGTALHHREVWTLIGLDKRPLDEVLASLPKQPAEMVD